MKFTSLTSAAEWERLKSGFDHKQIVKQEAVDRGRFRALWPEGFLNEVLAYSALTGEQSIRMLLRGEEVEPSFYRDDHSQPKADAIEKLQRVGATVSLGRVDAHSNHILELVRDFEVEMGCPTRANSYLTPGNASGFPAHTDRHDVLVLQLEGEKHWLLGLEKDEQQAVVIKAGDWIFIPQGVWHEVTNQASSPSVHLAIGFKPPTLGALLTHALSQARKQKDLYELPMEYPHKPIAKKDAMQRAVEMIEPFIDPVEFKEKYTKSVPNFGVMVPPADLAETKASCEEPVYLWNNENASVKHEESDLRIHLPYRKSPITLRPEWHQAVLEMKGPGEIRSSGMGPDQAGLCRFLAGLGVLRRK